MIIELFLSLAMQTGGQPVSIPIQNPSFELPTTLPDQNSCGQSTWRDIPGWTFTQSSGGSFGVIAWTCQAPPDGKQVASLGNSSMFQDLKVAPQIGIYVLKFYVANWFYSYIGGYSASITEGTKTVCATSGWAVGDFTQVTAVCPVSGYIANNDRFWSSPGNLVLHFSNSEGWPIIVDNISLTFTPTN